MKYTIHGFQQTKLIENKLNNDDALVLRVIKDLYDSNKMDEIQLDNKKFVWINQTYLLEQIPIVGKKRFLQKKLKQYEDIGLIERQILIEKDGIKGRFSYLHIAEKFEKLSEYDKEKSELEPYAQHTQPYAQNTQPLRTTCVTLTHKKRNKDNTIRDNNIKDNIYIDLTFIEDCIDTVKLTQEQYNNLIDKFDKKLVNNQILDLDNYIVNGDGKKYKDHYKVLLNWCNKEMKNKKVDKPIKEVKPAYHLPFDFSKL